MLKVNPIAMKLYAINAILEFNAIIREKQKFWRDKRKYEECQWKQENLGLISVNSKNYVTGDIKLIYVTGDLNCLKDVWDLNEKQ